MVKISLSCFQSSFLRGRKLKATGFTVWRMYRLNYCVFRLDRPFPRWIDGNRWVGGASRPSAMDIRCSWCVRPVTSPWTARWMWQEMFDDVYVRYIQTTAEKECRFMRICRWLSVAGTLFFHLNGPVLCRSDEKPGSLSRRPRSIIQDGFLARGNSNNCFYLLLIFFFRRISQPRWQNRFFVMKPISISWSTSPGLQSNLSNCPSGRGGESAEHPPVQFKPFIISADGYNWSWTVNFCTGIAPLGQELNQPWFPRVSRENNFLSHYFGLLL